MKVVLLGTGTSQGVPVLGCGCEVCKSSDLHDQRLRSSALIETASTRVLIDCGPDFRTQMLKQPFRKIDAVLLTHIHYDHVGGIDDLRPYCKFGDINLYADASVVQGLRHNMPYCFPTEGILYPGVPRLNLHEIEAHKPISIGDMDIIPVRVMHGQLPILGFRIGKLAYITDMKYMEETEYPYLNGIEVLVVNALRWKREHHSHTYVSHSYDTRDRFACRCKPFVAGRHQIWL